MTNTVIMVWMKHPNAGFGDLLRGTMYLHKLSQKMNFNLKVDMQLHPVSQFLLAPPHDHSEYVIQTQSKIVHIINDPFQTQSIEKLIGEYQLKSGIGPILITTNYCDNLHESPSFECRRFMRSLLVPNDEFKTYFNVMCNTFKIIKNYSIVHFRLGDDALLKPNANPESSHAHLLPIIDANMDSTAYIMTDSMQFKQHLRMVRPGLADRIIPTTPIHLSHSTETDVASVKETLFDFMLLMNARVIKTHSTYGWISGFVHWGSHIFNVPLINLKPRIQPVGMKTKTPSYSTNENAPLMQPIVSFMKPIRPRTRSKLAFNKMF